MSRVFYKSKWWIDGNRRMNNTPVWKGYYIELNMFFADSGNHRNVFGGFRETRRVTGLQAFHNFTRGIKRINKWNWTGRRLRRLVRVAVIISNAVERLRLCIHNQNRSAIVPLNMSEESIGSFFRWNDRPIKRAVKKIPAQSTHATMWAIYVRNHRAANPVVTWEH